jgi:peroxiredoxin
MKHSIFLLAAALTAASPAMAALEIGKPAPLFSAVDSNGKKHSLSDFKGKTVVLEWTNDQCPFVKKHYDGGNMQSLQKSATGKGVVWLSIVSSAKGKQGHVEGKQANALTLSRKAAPSAVLLDPTGMIGKQYAAKTTPHMYVVTPKGTLAYMGAIDSIPSGDPADIKSATNYVTEALASVAAGKPVKTPVTQPYGCSIKY